MTRLIKTRGKRADRLERLLHSQPKETSTQVDSWENKNEQMKRVVTLWEDADGYRVHIYTRDYDEGKALRFVFRNQGEAVKFFELTKNAWIIY